MKDKEAERGGGGGEAFRDQVVGMRQDLDSRKIHAAAAEARVGRG